MAVPSAVVLDGKVKCILVVEVPSILPLVSGLVTPGLVAPESAVFGVRVLDLEEISGEVKGILVVAELCVLSLVSGLVA